MSYLTDVLLIAGYNNGDYRVISDDTFILFDKNEYNQVLDYGELITESTNIKITEKVVDAHSLVGIDGKQIGLLVDLKNPLENIFGKKEERCNFVVVYNNEIRCLPLIRSCYKKDFTIIEYRSTYTTGICSIEIQGRKFTRSDSSAGYRLFEASRGDKNE